MGDGDRHSRAVQPCAYAAAPVGESASGSGKTQKFTLVFSDGAGATDLGTARVVFGSSTTSFSGLCFVWVKPSTGQAWLANDAFTDWSATLTLGTAGTPQNSQCSIDGTASSGAIAGNTYTLTLAMTFNASYTGAKTTYAYATTNAGLPSGWQALGSWTVTAPVTATPQAVSVTPPTGSGNSQTFTFVFSDGTGAADLGEARVVFGVSTNSFTGSCHIWVKPSTGEAQLADDSFSNWTPALKLGRAGTLQNSQCSLNSAASSGSMLGNNYTLTLAMTFKASYAGAKTIYGYAMTNAGLPSGWQALGAWTVSAPAITAPQAVSVNPASGSGNSQKFVFVFSDAAGAADLGTAEVVFGTPANLFAGSCFIWVRPSSGEAWLANDNFTAWSPAFTLGAPGMAQNSQCSIDGAASSASIAGNNYTLTLAMTFKASYTGGKTAFGYAATNAGLPSAWQTLGSWTVTTP